MNLDEQLKLALRRIEPPDGFAGRLLARTAEKRVVPVARQSWWAWLNSGPKMAWATACVLLVALLVPSGLEYRRRQQGEMAKQQVMLALEIAGSKLNYAKMKALRFGPGEAGEER
jgi:hypothetical protein